jgi:aspartate/methionine/tyrosine aminotransferase
MLTVESYAVTPSPRSSHQDVAQGGSPHRQSSSNAAPATLKREHKQRPAGPNPSSQNSSSTSGKCKAGSNGSKASVLNTKRRDYIVGAMTNEFALESALDTEESEYVVVSQPKSLISFLPPMAGMFLWIRVALELHPLYDGKNSVELMDELWKRLCITEDLLIAPRRMFAAGEERKDEVAKYFRVAFSVGEEPDVDEMVKRFGRAVRWFFKGET